MTKGTKTILVVLAVGILAFMYSKKQTEGTKEQ